MQGWVSTDSAGREYLVRTGTGTVTAVVPTPSGTHVEIDCTPVAQRPRAIRYVVSAMVSEDVDVDVAHGQSCVWTIEWHRRDDVPSGIPVLALDLSTDATACLTLLAPVLAATDVEAVT